MEQLDAHGVAFSELVVEVFRTNGLLLQAGDDLTRPVGLTSARWQVLGVVENRPSTVAEVARAMGLARQSVRQTASSLAADGLIRFQENPRHRRARLMALTDAGREALRYVEARQAVWANHVAKRVAPAELRAAVRTLRALGRELETDEPEQESQWPVR